jgi:hypothetical protein
MPEKLHWTQPADAQLRRLRAEGATWDAIAAAMRVSRSAVIEHGRRIGARLPPPDVVPEAVRELMDPAREPLRAGHPVSWRAITAGTLLAGSRYPWPPWREWECG